MLYRNFGKTGLKVSELVFGGGAVGGLLIDKDEATREAAIARAFTAGINWIDTAPAYGNGRSEEALGRLLKGRKLPDGNAPFLSTKFQIDTSDVSDIYGQIMRSVDASLKRLDRGSVTLLQMHNRIGRANDGRMLSEHDILKDGGVLDALGEIRRQGLTRFFGITALGETPSILRVIQSGQIHSAQVYYNLLNPSAGLALPPSWPAYDFTGILDACRKHGVAAMGIRVFSAGVLATDARHGREAPLTPGDTVESETAKARAMFDALGAQYGSRAQTALRFALSEPRLSCAIFGLAELAHLDEALAAQAAGPLPDAGLAAVKAVYARTEPA
jgi:L-galactose dehydrogenase/L-glyceraldehyde 3-phosphate reductase